MLGNNDFAQLGDDGASNGREPVQVVCACGCTTNSPYIGFYIGFNCCSVDTACSCPVPASRGALAPFSAAVGGVPFNIRTYYAIRDLLLAGTAAGRRYIDLYNTNDAAIRSALLAHPALWAEGLALLLRHTLRKAEPFDAEQPLLFRAQPFMLPAVSPSTMYF